GDIGEDPSPRGGGRSPADHGQHPARISAVERVGEGERDAFEGAGVEICRGGGGVDAEHGAAQALVTDRESLPTEGGQDQQARRAATALVLAVLEETVGTLGSRAAEVGLACPGGGGAGGEDRGDAQLGATGEGEAVRGAVDRGVLLGGSDGGDPAAGAERGVVLARGRPGDAEGGGRSIP